MSKSPPCHEYSGILIESQAAKSKPPSPQIRIGDSQRTTLKKELRRKKNVSIQFFSLVIRVFAVAEILQSGKNSGRMWLKIQRLT